MADGIISKIQLPDSTIYDVVDNTSGYMTGMTILSYGSSTWQNFIDAYSDNKVVYCRASSNANPATGSQTRLAFMAYVNNATTPTNVEFQYYRSVSSHTASQQGDQVYVYKLDKTAGWSVTTREASVKVVAGTGLGGTYSNGTMTLTGPTKVSDLTNDSGFITEYTETDPIFTASAAYGISSSDITSWSGKQDSLVSGTNIKTINSTSILGSGDISITDNKVAQSASTSNSPQPVLFRNNVGTSASDSTEGARYVTSVTITPKTGDITATKFNGYTLAGACAKAVDTSISANSSSVNLPTSSAVASFVEGKGYITGYTETDPTVPSWAKASSKPSYTFAEIGSKPTSLSGYGITDAKIENGMITLGSNTIIPLTSFIETDPVFTASVAHGITSSDITNWNGKQATLVSGTNIKTINGDSILGSGDLTVTGGTQVQLVRWS